MKTSNCCWIWHKKFCVDICRSFWAFGKIREWFRISPSRSGALVRDGFYWRSLWNSELCFYESRMSLSLQQSATLWPKAVCGLSRYLTKPLLSFTCVMWPGSSIGRRSAGAWLPGQSDAAGRVWTEAAPAEFLPPCLGSTASASVTRSYGPCSRLPVLSLSLPSLSEQLYFFFKDLGAQSEITFKFPTIKVLYWRISFYALPTFYQHLDCQLTSRVLTAQATQTDKKLHS